LIVLKIEKYVYETNYTKMTNELLLVGILLAIISVMCVIYIIAIRIIEHNEGNDIDILNSTTNELYTIPETENTDITHSNSIIEL